MAPLDSLLETYRTQTTTERDKGTAFEKLIAAWLVTDPVQAKRFERVELWSDWARRNDRDRQDVGIDLVGTLHGGKFAAIQCKFYSPERRIRKEDIDSFISASAKHDFAERLIVETTEKAWSEYAREMLRDQTLPTNCIGLRDLRESSVNWADFAATGKIERPTPKTLRPHQQQALEAVKAGLAEADRGKLIMACGTGKTLTGLRITEDLVGAEGFVLLLVPSLTLMSHTIFEWCTDAINSLTAFAVCSDTQVGKRRKSKDDIAELEISDLAFPATTDAQRLAGKVAEAGCGSMRVVFATYQSLSVIAAAQSQYELPDFDLIVCDEAHRTTGATYAGEAESNFVKVHDNYVIRGNKRLYMTATPRIYGENAKSKARDADVALSSMDDPELFGELLFHYGFSQAVENGILSDYRVIVLAMDEGQISTAVQSRLSDGSSQLVLDDATKIVGCWKALSKIGLDGNLESRAEPMRRALAFCRSIDSSKLVRNEFEQVVREFQSASNGSEEEGAYCEVRHVDGTYNARDRGRRLDWLKEGAGKNVCRILSNARCLTEGVDVPALDAIMFLHPRNSQIDVVQAVGRVMRKTSDKEMGYVILPVGIPPDLDADQALNDNERYRVVWQILNALRAHDERLDAVINQGGLGQDVSNRISIIDGRVQTGITELAAITATVEELPARTTQKGSGIGERPPPTPPTPPVIPLPLVIDEFSRAVMAKIVEKCGTREYWEDWAKDVAQIAERHITRIGALVSQSGSDAHQWFEDFLKELRDDLNDSVTENDAIEMLAQHLITRPVFDAVFEGHAFVERNPVSKAMTEVLSVIDEAEVGREAKSLEGFYASVRRRAAGITDPLARQNLIIELYDKFFRGAFPLTTQRLGIVYTPVEIVDFIIRSVDEVLRDQFGQTLGSKGVHVLDPFTGTGTFVTRLLQSGLIEPENLERKYREEIHANEIVLLAYYIAAINIESVFHWVTGRDDYLPYTGICLTDTFALHEGDDELSYYMKDNTDRRERQKSADIRVIFGNPPYSTGQKSADDNAQNIAYSGLDERIRSTYSTRGTKGTKKKGLYDSYIRAIRWGSDRLGEVGIMAYVSGSAWTERSFADGMRKCLAEEFSTIHVFHLRGDIRKNMLSSGLAAEGENVFGQRSMTGIAISVFVKNPGSDERGNILFHDIGDSLGRQEKLNIISRFVSVQGLGKAVQWTKITPDDHGDWIDQRDVSFEAFPRIGNKRDMTGDVLFRSYSMGVDTHRDVWCINPSEALLAENVESTIDFYNVERMRWKRASATGQRPDVKHFVNLDSTRIKWGPDLFKGVETGQAIRFDRAAVAPIVYRPFTKQWVYFNPQLNWSLFQLTQIFPDGGSPNRVIVVTGKGGRSGFSTLMMDSLPNLHTVDSGQCFPLWLYEPVPSGDSDLLSKLGGGDGLRRRNTITDFALDEFKDAYPSENIACEDVFHYIYGLLHSEEYRKRFRASLAKELPRIPCVKSVEDYRTFRDAGKRLGQLHVGYESVDPYPADIDSGGKFLSMMDLETAYRVEKMKFAGTSRNKDKSTVIYNPHITIRDIPPSAWNYIVNGKPALQWVMDRQCVKTDKASGIVSDANRYAIETVGDPRYPLDLFLRVITVSLETNEIVKSLPKLALE
ncbi:MAG: DEAD/DEAH box helicase [Gammaproteobacteria bacterium]|nr:DEAD/DEAH box helicase [Gammaproteobacteria bacterium]MYL14818.1 DEAD/DEAH box helicase [Gammaproteobacteria bacterium]